MHPEWSVATTDFDRETDRMNSYKLAALKDIPENKPLVVLGPDGNEIALFRIEDKIYALDNTCPHAGGPLGEGEVENACVTCPWHGWTFELSTGSCKTMPGMDATTIPVEIRGEEIFLSERIL